MIDAALAIIGTRPPEQARIMRIRNTLQLEELEVSEPCLEDPERQTEFAPMGQPASAGVRRRRQSAAVM